MPTESTSVTSALTQLSQDGEALLKIHFPRVTVADPGVEVSREMSGPAPELSISTGAIKSKSAKFIALSLDPDAPLPSFPVLGPIVHGFQADLQASGQPDDEGWIRLQSSLKPVIPYLGPAPPRISSAHRYVFLVWEQPEDLDSGRIRADIGLPEDVGMMARMRWDQGALEKKLGLGPVLAVNYFLSK